MNPLHLSGYGVKIKVRNLRSRSELEIKDGKEWVRGWGKTPRTFKFRPRRIPYNSIIVDGHSGYISLQALHWLSRNKVPIFVLDHIDGSIVSSILSPIPVKADLRAAQIQASADPKKTFSIADSLVQAKVARSLQVLDWLAQRYDIEKEVELTKQEAEQLHEARSVPEVRAVEGRVALRYWQAFSSAIPESLDFQGRMTSSHPNNASDPVNSALNYAYGVLEGECRRTINAVGLEPSIGFLHDVSTYQTKHSLVYDLQEPFRWIVDVTIIEGFESGALDLPDFYFTGDDYRYRIENDARRRLLDLLRARFNLGVRYNNRSLRWDTVIERKAVELGRFLTGRSARLDFTEPTPTLPRTDGKGLRRGILSLAQSDARRIRIGKSTLHYLRKRARHKGPLKVYKKIERRLASLTSERTSNEA